MRVFVFKDLPDSGRFVLVICSPTLTAKTYFEVNSLHLVPKFLMILLLDDFIYFVCVKVTRRIVLVNYLGSSGSKCLNEESFALRAESERSNFLSVITYFQAFPVICSIACPEGLEDRRSIQK